MIKSRHKLDYCNQCKREMVRCADCNNNCCNGTEICSSCFEAYLHQEFYFEYPKQITFAETYYHNHWIKTIINPIITKFGWILVSRFDDNKFLGFSIKTYPEHCKGPFKVWFKIRIMGDKK